MHLWEGVYERWEDAPERGGAFDSSYWLESSVGRAEASLNRISTPSEEISENSCCHDYILPVVCAMARQRGRNLKILDFGGGLGSSFFSVVTALQVTENLEYHVVEGKSICDMAKLVFPNDLQLFFHETIPNGEQKFDVIHAGSSLQYIDDWRSLLASFAASKPRYLILADVLAGDIQSFVTVQNYYDYKIRIRFLNLRELVCEAEKLGFRLLYKSLYLSKILGKEGPLPMSNFPAERRLKYPCQLLFQWGSTQAHGD